MVRLAGAIAAVTTPFREDGSLDVDGYRSLIEDVIGDGVDGIVVNGCTGESWALDDSERATIFRAAADQARGRLPIVAGCGDISIRGALGKIRQATEAGCSAVMLQPPWYIVPSQGDILRYYETLVAASDLPVMLYNIPRRTGVSLGFDILDRLADEDKVVAIKESSKDWVYLSEVIRRYSGRMNVLAGYIGTVGLAALGEGAAGYVDSSTPVLGKVSTEFFRAATGGDLPRARSLQVRISKLRPGFEQAGSFPAGIKVALNILGRAGGHPRDPIAPPGPAQYEVMRRVLISAGLLAEPEAAAA